ncbi:Ig-like domain-containing protein [Heyndrickxia sp. NPDC080065]|uniref:Ig-like domain-containing protein n=1 Tax=Heyndrickxia sp. NPDC080065 TaxID=3390568 RepID=UPI003D01A657
MKKLKSMRKVVFSLLVFLLVFSNAFIGLKGAKAESNEDKAEIASLTKELHTKKLQKTSEENNNYKDSDTVRVIVELEGAPAIETATKQGVRYKDLTKSKQESLQQTVVKEQKNFISTLKSKKVNLDIEDTFTTVVNGVSGTIKYGNIKELKKLPNVEGVYIANEYKRPEIKPNMVTSKEQVGAGETWKLMGYKGEGMVVGIIDSGIDPTHKDMVLSEGTHPKLTKSSVTDAIAKYKLSGVYHREKVPYGYNYFDKNQDIIDTNPGTHMHGMHVAGTVAANGDEKNGGIQGIAPEAQLLALKVFGNDPKIATTNSTIYIKAIDDAIKLGADVLNMSLGSPAGFVEAEHPDQKAIKNAVDNGIIMSISAGNEDNFASGFETPPFASNPDIGLVGTPSVTNESISVASLENTHMNVDGLTYKVNGEEKSLGFLSAGSTHPNDVEQKTFEILAAGLGKPEDFTDKDFTGKYALIKRGDISFAEKALNAQKEGAAGVIIYNNQSGLVNMASDEAVKIPQLFLQQLDGDTLKKEIDSGKKVEITFTGKKSEMVNPSSGQMSDFTSWGLTPNLDFKPELTAPGGQIYSTLNKDQYGLMSGTSMAAPHVAGGSALMLEYVQKTFPELNGADKVNRAKILMMNTAIAVEDPEEKVLYSPRRQGAGLMKLDAAVQTPVYVTNKGTNEAKVALKEIDGNVVSITLTATNFSDKDVTYHVDTTPLTDLIEDGYNLLTAQKIEEAQVSIDKSEVKIPANGSEDVTITIDLSKADAELSALMENGYFVEGFVTFKADEESGIPTLSVPYVGFKGDWNKAPVLDPMVYDEGSFYEIAGMLDQKFNYLGYNPITDTVNKSKIAFSPNTGKNQNKIVPVLTFLRNSKIVNYSIVDAKKNKVRNIFDDEYQTKNYFDANELPTNNMYELNPNYTSWDGKDENNKVVEDGQYYYQITTQVDYPGKEPQVLEIPVIVDTKAPEIHKLAYDANSEYLTIEASDKDGSGINYFEIYVNGKLLGGVAATDATLYQVKIPGLAGTNLTVVAVDYAGNKSSLELKDIAPGTPDPGTPDPGTPDPGTPGETTAPDAPVVHSVSDKDITVTGTAEKGSTIEVYAKDVKLGSGVTAEDGTFSISISKQKAGTKLTVTAKNATGVSKATEVVVLDKTAPEAPKVNAVSDKDTKVTGTAEAGSTVTVFAGKTTLGSGTADKDGKFSITIKKQKAGTALTVTATDKAGNTSNATKVVVLDKTPPAAPSVNSVTSSTTKVTGKAEAGSKVVIKAGNKQIGYGSANKDGKFSISIKAQNAKTTLSVTATDKAGNVSKEKSVQVKATVPTVKSATQTKVTGKAKAGAKVYVKVGNKVVGSTKANKAGNYSIKIKKQKSKTSISVYAVENGLQSGVKKAKIK